MKEKKKGARGGGKDLMYYMSFPKKKGLTSCIIFCHKTVHTIKFTQVKELSGCYFVDSNSAEASLQEDDSDLESKTLGI